MPAAATDASLKAFFGPDCTGVKFETFPGSMARFVRVDFGSSNGLTEAILKKGQVLLGVPLDISVMHPVHQQELHKAQAPAAQPAIRPPSMMAPLVPGMPVVQGVPLVPGMPGMPAMPGGTPLSGLRPGVAPLPTGGAPLPGANLSWI